MTYNEMMILVNTLSESGDCILTFLNGECHIDIFDFIGFDKNWNEEYRAYTRPELVEQLEEYAEEYGDGKFYCTFEVEGHRFVLGYTSYDI